MNKPRLGFELKRITLPLDVILPIRAIKEPRKEVSRYTTILASVKEVGLVEPLIVYPQKDAYILVDGHLRHHALKEIGAKEAECILSTEDEGFTYNARINRIAPVQEHKMITKAVKSGVAPERIAAALNMKVEDIRARLNLLDGINAEAVELLKDKHISPGALRVLKKVSAIRQIEMAELMVSVNNFSSSYAHALLIGTPRDHLLDSGKPKSAKGVSPEEIARMEEEIEMLEQDFKAAEESYGVNVLNLTVLRQYIKKLLVNGKVVRFLNTNYPEIFAEMESVANTETL